MIDIKNILETAAEQQISDVHISPEKPVFLRKYRVLRPFGDIVHNQDILDFLKDILPSEKRECLESKKQLDFLYKSPSGNRFRGNIYYQDNGIAVNFRVIQKYIIPLPELGFPQFVIDKISKLQHGLILVVGPTGQGKSTTLASFLDTRANTNTEHIMTLEDPIEYALPQGTSLVHQREIGRDISSFKEGILGCLREDPDVVMVGEMRDLDSIQSTLTLAETGKLVMATLHTSGGAQTISRIIDVFNSDTQEQIRSQLAMTLTMIISQKLIPRLDGSGLVLAYEILTANYAIQNYIRQNKIFQIPNVFQTDTSGEQVQMEQSLAGLVLAGIITADSAYENSHNPEQLKAILIANGV